MFMDKNRRDSKDPMPSAGFTARGSFGGNDPGDGKPREKCGSGTGEKVSVESRFDSSKPGPEQPERDGGGNKPVSQAMESHGQKKAEHVKASQRF